MIKSSILSKCQKDDTMKIFIGLKPNKDGVYESKKKGWREFSGYLKSDQKSKK